MKKLIHVLGLALLTLNASPSFARSVQLPSEHAQIIRMSIDPSLPYAGTVSEGSIHINHVTRTVQLDLYGAPKCEPGAACPEYMIYEQVQLPLISIQYGQCNERIILAQRDMRPADGALEVLEVIDHSSNRCPTAFYMPLVPTEIAHHIRFETRRGPVEHHSSFSAKRLVRSFR